MQFLPGHREGSEVTGPGFVRRTCMCGRRFATDSNEYFCSQLCEDESIRLAEERDAEDRALDACRPWDDEDTA
jgi:hypothetical protein